MAAYAALLSLYQTTHHSTTQHESLFSIDVAKEVRSIHTYVSSLLWFFEEFPTIVNRWEGMIRDIAYEVDTIIQTLMFHREMIPSGLRLEILTKELGLIEGEVRGERLLGRVLTYSSSSLSTPRLAAVGNNAVIGLDDDLRKLRDQLCGGQSKLQIIPITGMGGIGKTTLARTLYNDQCIIEHFGTRAWGVASQDYHPLRFWRNLLGSMTVSGKQMVVDEIDESSLKLKVYQTLMGRKYIIVLDDVWEKQVWDDLRAYFPNDDNGSRIMLTTRELDVAFHPNSVCPVHKMGCLDRSQSWDLLRQKVFANSYCPPELEGVGKRIAEKCGGLPLAVVLVAGVLSANVISEVSWQEIAKVVSPIVGQDLKAILSLSYTKLPHHLRSCFLFIGGFEKGVTIRTSRLLRLWTAEGFEGMKERSCQKSFEEKAEEYLEELVKRNLVTVTSRKIDGRVKSCTLHDLVRDLCIRQSHEEKFLRVVDDDHHPQALVNEPRISFSRSNVGIVRAPTLRTILCFQTQRFPSWLVRLGEHKLLKELDASGLDLKGIPSKVFELYHLRYLALMGSFSIPPAISSLVNLQTLIIHTPFGNLRGRYADVVTHSLPLKIWRLKQLKHLFFHAPYMLPQPPQGSVNHPLQYLQTLLLIENLEWNETIVEMIPNVKRLGLTYRSNREYRLHLLRHLHQLEKLEVIGYPGFTWRGRDPSFPITLKKLILVGGEFPWSDMAIVGSLPNLQVLKLLDNACHGEKWKVVDEGFPSLIFFLIEESNILEWTVETESFPRLKRLVLRSCPFLEKIPEDIGEIPTLELIEVDYCTQSLLDSAKKIKDDQEDNGNVALQVRVGHEYVNRQSYFISGGEREIWMRQQSSASSQASTSNQRHEIDEIGEFVILGDKEDPHEEPDERETFTLNWIYHIIGLLLLGLTLWSLWDTMKDGLLMKKLAVEQLEREYRGE